ncbi:MAG: ribosome maturation factor [Candidatus Zixiibacteriota bacterium]|jgi:ribosome maturation factor RimP
MVLAEDIREKVCGITASVVGALGLDVWDVALNRGPKSWIIQVVLDRPEGYVSLEDCSEVNVRLRARLELEDLPGGDFDLEVSSPGLNRRLRGPKDYYRFRGMLARFKIKKGMKPKVIIGRIVNVGEDTVELDAEDGRHEFDFAAVAEARLEPELPGFEKAAGPRKKNRPGRKAR